MPHRLHLAAGRASSRFVDAALIDEARRHATVSGGTAVEVASVQEAYDAIEASAHPIESMDIHSHGGGGFVTLSTSNSLTQDSWQRFQPLASRFAPGARVEFFGCAVARGAAGELFIARCAWYLLRVNGGEAVGYTATGFDTFAVLGDLSEGTPVSTGQRVTARVARGGHVTLTGALTLDLASTKYRLERAVERCGAETSLASPHPSKVER